MKINITGHHIEVTEGIRNHTEKKIARIKRHFNNPVDANMTISLERKDHKVDINMHALGYDFHVSKSSSNLYTAIDEAVDVLDLQIKKRKEKREDSRKHHNKTTMEQ